ncbi:DUF6585 family protein [Nocardia transvalensis]|uniref:DUF6585 family protein n=1 Tax=Nocardia transvalensis TaxID=37333 RepID=UPI001892D3A4|nr:DUF6585 family protein [Nocardia transvalensis]MBF6328173.1 hypothetical protein [Nocardia transvalensis]
MTHVGESQQGSPTSAAIGAAAAQAGLGRHQACYPGAVPRWGTTQNFFLVLWFALACWGFAAGNLDYAAFPALFFVFMVGGFVRARIMAVRRRDMRLDLYEAGLTVTLQGQVRVVRFDSTEVLQNLIRHYRNGIATGTSYEYTVTDLSGQPMKLTHKLFVNAPAWGEAIQTAVTRAQLPRAHAALTAGSRLQFGDIWMTAHEIGSGNDAVPWRDVSKADAARGRFGVEVAGRFLPVIARKVSDIPNYFVFISLADHLRASHRPPQH